MSLFLVNAKSLRRRAVRFTDLQLANVTLLPLFEDSGRVQSLLVVALEPQMVAMLEWHAGLLWVPWSAAVICSETTGVLRSMTSYQVSQAAKLWHYDPEWLLVKAGAGADVDYGPVIAMNCDGRWSGKVGGMFFRRDLSRISLVGLSQAGGGSNIVRWRAKYLPPGPAPRTAPLTSLAARSRGARTMWILDPIWQR